MTTTQTPARTDDHAYRALIADLSGALPADLPAEAIHAAAFAIHETLAHIENDRRTRDAAAATAIDDSGIRYGAVTRNVEVWADCHGINHSDSGEIVTHDRCGAQVVRRDDGRIFDVIRVGIYSARKFQCWRGAHECDPALVAAANAHRAADAAAGRVDVKGAMVVVARGRKVPRGTTGEVFWTGDKGYGLTVGIVTAAGVRHFTAAKNCDRI